METWLAQGVGGIAFVIGLVAFWQKNDLHFRYHMVVFCFFMAIHFFLMGALVATIGVILNGLRSLASIKTQSKEVMWFFILSMWVLTLPNIDSIFELITVFGSSIATWALFTKQGIKLRLFILLNSICWITHNIWLGSIGGSLVEGCFIITNLITIYRLYKLNREQAITEVATID
ncbi:YgjV family protein [Vibrio japonicus]|uniref:YgjV family protein n=1 Tax=Vibrio japonicus TaxID=1824638 RepID=A0ABY5LJW8_9VIBR|nr:YgjV family protein [Vibrio japonicus]UUM32379.1 YgjV family protein [Vibrio japonicus]